MLISERLRHLREEKRLSQGGIEKRSGLLRCYISRVEKRPHDLRLRVLFVESASNCPKQNMRAEETCGSIRPRDGRDVSTRWNMI